MTDQVSQAAPASLAAGVGQLTHEVIEREMRTGTSSRIGGKWVVTPGLTGGVSGSGESSADLSITKAGNRRLSACLIECSWRLVLQPAWVLAGQEMAAACCSIPKSPRRRRKQAIVAFARQLLIDLWKWKTGQVSAQQLGWVMS